MKRNIRNPVKYLFITIGIIIAIILYGYIIIHGNSTEKPFVEVTQSFYTERKYVQLIRDIKDIITIGDNHISFEKKIKEFLEIKKNTLSKEEYRFYEIMCSDLYMNLILAHIQHIPDLSLDFKKTLDILQESHIIMSKLRIVLNDRRLTRELLEMDLSD